MVTDLALDEKNIPFRNGWLCLTVTFQTLTGTLVRTFSAMDVFPGCDLIEQAEGPDTYPCFRDASSMPLWSWWGLMAR
jgi:hypothetical protein